MTEAQQPLGADIPVGQKTHHSRCEQRRNAHTAIDISYLRALEMQRHEHISPHRDQPGPPDEKFQEIHDYETKLYTHSGKIIKYPTFRTFTLRINKDIMSTITPIEAILKTTSRELEQIGEKILA